MNDIEMLINSIFELLHYDIVIWGFNLELWSFMVIDVVIAGLCYVIGRGIIDND